MKIIFGLGNPDDKYLKTRHNIGFRLLDLLADKYSADFKFDKNSNSKIAEIILENKEKLLLCKPQTFMNNSGQTISALTNYYKTELSDILIVQDEIDLPFGQIKFSENSGSAGHKGIQSIIDHLKTKDFKRLRFGIKSENNILTTEIFVLKNFSKEESEFIEKIEIKKLLLKSFL
jgi:PTH1 family peptidyl-tRNA hydrolase